MSNRIYRRFALKMPFINSKVKYYITYTYNRINMKKNIYKMLRTIGNLSNTKKWNLTPNPYLQLKHLAFYQIISPLLIVLLGQIFSQLWKCFFKVHPFLNIPNNQEKRLYTRGT